MTDSDGAANVPSGIISGNYEWPDHGDPRSHSQMSKDEPGSLNGKQKNNAGTSNFDLAYDAALRATQKAWIDFYAALVPSAKKKIAECCKVEDSKK